MPGPAPAWADLVDAVRDGRVQEADLDRKVLRILLLAERVGALEGSTADRARAARRRRVRARGRCRRHGAARERRHAAAGCRVPRRRSPSSATTPARPARRAAAARRCSPSTSSRRSRASAPRFPGAEVRYELGAVVQEGVAEIPLEQLTNPVTGEPGVRVTFFDADGAELFAEDRRATRARLVRRRRPDRGEPPRRARRRSTRPAETGEILLGFAGANPGRLFVDGELVLDDTPVIEGTDLGAAFLNPPSLTARVAVTAGAPDRPPRRVHPRAAAARSPARCSAHVRHRARRLRPRRRSSPARPRRPRPPMSRSSSSAPTRRSSPRATTARTSTCPAARTTSSAPSSRPNSRTIVVVNAGAPVVLPWARRSPPSCRATSAARSSAPLSPTC